MLTPEGGQFINWIARFIPPVSGIALECRMIYQDSLTSDASFRFQSQSGELVVLTGLCNSLIQNKKTSQPEIWQRICAFAKQFIDQPEHDKVLWLEFDYCQPQQTIPLPGLFFSIDNKQNIADIEDHIAFLQNRKLPPGFTRQLGQVCNAAPALAQPLYVGIFFSRQIQSTRVNIGIKPGMLNEYLQTYPLFTYHPQLMDIVNKLSGMISSTVINFDIDNSRAQILGIELKTDPDNWPELLNILIIENWCLPQVYGAITQWPAHHPRLNEPYSTDQFSIIPQNRASDVFVRRINHIKLCLTPDGLKTSKVYLYEGYGWLS